jgi:hypothetical protein
LLVTWRQAPISRRLGAWSGDFRARKQHRANGNADRPRGKCSGCSKHPTAFVLDIDLVHIKPSAERW